MSKVQHILVATDGSEQACRAAAFAGDLARALGARVTALMVQSEERIVPRALGPGEGIATVLYGSMSVSEIRVVVEKQAAEYELPATAAALGELSPAPALEQCWGHAAEEVCRYAAEHAVDLVVIGSHGRSGLTRVLLGSVSHQVANHASCPVVIVR